MVSGQARRLQADLPQPAQNGGPADWPGRRRRAAGNFPEFPELVSPDDCRQFLKDLNNRFSGKHPLLQDAARDFALRRWLELDAEGVLAEAERDTGAKDIGKDLFRVWLDLNPESAIAAWNQASPALATATRDAFLTSLAEKDVARAFALLSSPRANLGQTTWDPAREAIFRLWAQRDPLAALAAVKPEDKDSIGSGLSKQNSREAVFNGWASSDPAAFLAYVKSGADPECTLKNMAGWLVPALLKSDPKAAAEVIQAAAENVYGLYGLASKWARDDPQGAIAWAETQPSDSPQAQAVKLHAATKVATADPLRAIALLGVCHSLGSGEQGFWLDEGYREAFAALTASDPDKAREMIAGDPERAKQGAMNGYLTHAFARDPAEAIAQAREWLKIPALASSVVPAISNAYSVSNGAPPRDFSPVLAAMPELASQVSGDTMQGWALAAPESAAEFLASREASGKPVEGLKENGVLTSIANSRPEWTSGWLNGLPEGQLRQETAGMLAENWSSYDPEAAKAWIDSLPPGPSREAAVKAWGTRLEIPKNPFLSEE